MDIHPLNGALIADLKKDYPGGVVQKPELIAGITRFCHSNIQFYRAVKESEPFRAQLHAMFGDYCTPADLAAILERASISVLAEEFTPPVGRYPNTFFIRNTDEMNAFIDDMMKLPASHAARRPLADASFFCVGSCFATNVAYHLSRIGARIHTTVLAESVNSPRNNVDLFHYLETGERRGLLLNEEVTRSIGLEGVREAFRASDTLILTLGCAYSLIHGVTGQPLGKMEAGAVFDQPTVSSIVAQLRSIIAVCERHNFRDMFVTVSPVPLAGTLVHELNPFISDSASKAMLRAAVEDLRAQCPVQYIPSFEVFRQGALHSTFPTFGLADGYSRHVNPDMTERVISNFVRNHFEAGSGH